MCAIGKSLRASTERELICWNPDIAFCHTRVAVDVVRAKDEVRVQLDFKTSSETNLHQNGGGSTSVQKYLRVNGIPRRAAEFVGQINAVLFTADDLSLIFGTPSVRRKYLDILLSQLDQTYLRALQRYQQILKQRNYLLKSANGNRLNDRETEFWNQERASVGGTIMFIRSNTITELSHTISPIHEELVGGKEELNLVYRPSVSSCPSANATQCSSSILKALEKLKHRELSQKTTVVGPHRDDFRLLLNGSDASLYASRGEARTMVLAMKLGEVKHLEEQSGQVPIVLLDDVLSELDKARRAHILNEINKYGQCLITTAEPESIQEGSLLKMSNFSVSKGTITSSQNRQ